MKKSIVLLAARSIANAETIEEAAEIALRLVEYLTPPKKAHAPEEPPVEIEVYRMAVGEGVQGTVVSFSPMVIKRSGKLYRLEGVRRPVELVLNKVPGRNRVDIRVRRESETKYKFWVDQNPE